MKSKYPNLLILLIFFQLSCSSNLCVENEGNSFANINYREWDLGLATFQYTSIQNCEPCNEIGCEGSFIRIFTTRYFIDNGICRFSGEIILDSVPISFNQKIKITGNSFYRLRDADVFAEKYPFQEIPGFESYIILTKEESNCQKIFGQFQASFVFDDRFKLIDPMSPDTLFFTNGVFEAELIN